MTGADWKGSLVGLPWSFAEAVLRHRGSLYRTVATSPPGRDVQSGEWRVVQERQETDALVLTLARYRPRGGAPEEGVEREC